MEDCFNYVLSIHECIDTNEYEMVRLVVLNQAQHEAIHWDILLGVHRSFQFFQEVVARRSCFGVYEATLR